VIRLVAAARRHATHLRKLLRRACKNAQRLQAIGEARIAIEETIAGAVAEQAL